MATAAISAQGTQFKRGDGGSPETFSLIKEIKTFSGPQASAAEIDVTSLDSTAREFIAGLVDFGEFSAQGNWLPQDVVHKALRTDFINRTTRNYQLLFPDATLASFAAFVKEFPVSGGVDQALEASVTWRITGPVTFTP